MCCTNYGSYGCGRGRFGQLCQRLRQSMRRSSLVRTATVAFLNAFTDVHAALSHHQAVDTSLPPPELIADSVKRSSRAHMFHLYSLLCEIASVPRKAPSAWIASDRLVVASSLSGGLAGSKEKEESAAAVRTHHPGSSRSGSGSGLGHLVSFDARGLARDCLKEVGRELGVP
jgi:hypothetical protein